MTSPRLPRVLRASAKRLLYAAGGPAKQRWSIGIYRGDGPHRFGPADDLGNPVLRYTDVSDVPALYVADPFMLALEHTWFMFFELLNARAGKGEIGLATSQDLRTWRYRGVVLAEPFHLSYPYVFPWMDSVYMIPESHETRSIRLYRATRFPREWTLVGTLLTDRPFADSSVFRFRDRWWLLADTSPDVRHDTLRLYVADTLTGPWVEHPCSPIVEGGPDRARPAGRVVSHGDRVVRYAQDCRVVYGAQVRAFEITELSRTTYHERELADSPVLCPTGAGWNRSRMHHIDPHHVGPGRWVACVDGWGV